MNNHGVNSRRDLTTIDVELERAKQALEKAASRVSHGRITVTVERYDRATIGHRLEVDQLTEDDLVRIMTEKPRGTR
ncbi:MAG: hypothetical protein JXA87_02175 [Thermoleophilia bacterium]|nr:hypothetical protein [Thermoleophilia bacterium]